MDMQGRFKFLIEKNTKMNGRFAELEFQTGISANSWKSFWHGRQRPTVNMMEAIFTKWPQYAFWVATGYCDSPSGHVAPDGIESIQIKRVAVFANAG